MILPARRSLRPFRLLPQLLLALALLAPAAAQERPTVPPSEYGRWEYLSRTGLLAPDGGWLAYSVTRVDEHRELRVQALTATSADARVFEWGSGPEFSANSRWLAWTVGPSTEERERLQESGEPVRDAAALLELGSDGDPRRFEAVASFAFDAAGHHLALLGYAPQEPEGKGADLRVIDLDDGSTMTFGNVAEFAWSDTGAWLAFVVATGSDEGNGVQLYDAAGGALRSLHSSGSSYRGLAWRDDAADLAFYRSAEAASADGSEQVVHAVRALDGATAEYELAGGDAGVSADLEIVAHRTLEWSDDGSMIATGLRPVEDADAENAEAEEPEEGQDPEGEAAQEGGAENEEPSEEPAEELELPGLQIWHAADVRVYAQQQAAEQRDARRTLLAVWHLDAARLVRVGEDLLEGAQLLHGWRRAVENSSAPYPWGAKFGRPYHDVWVVDVASGDRELLAERVRYSWPSAGGGYVLVFDGGDYWTYELATGTRTNITANIDAAFERTEYDTPTDLLPPWGTGGWLAGDEAVLLYDEFDIWRVAPDGSDARRLTAGAADELIHRITVLDPEEFGEPIDPAAPVYLSLRNERTEQRGYGRLAPGGDRAETLILDEHYVTSLRRAEEADVLVYRAEARDDSPDFYVAGPDLAGPRQVTETNPWQADYAWTRAELVDFVSEGGRDLQAGLLYPADYEPGRRYPMIVYTYEILAPQIHIYEAPSERDYYNFTAWTQNGYFVLMPDIVYPWREPGRGAIESVRAAVKAVVDRGLVDADRVGLIGHSWGGWQAAYLPTRVDTFAAAVSGAPLTDFVSFMGQMHWGPGIPELNHWETGQGRMEVPYWEDPEAHHRSSPIHAIEDLDTPMLMVHGNEDGVVEFFQSVLYYNYARRADKRMVMLVYEGEDHGFRNEANQIDYHRRILEWFGHYLKGEPAPAWITEGIAFEDQEDERRRVARRPDGER